MVAFASLALIFFLSFSSFLHLLNYLYLDSLVSLLLLFLFSTLSCWVDQASGCVVLSCQPGLTPSIQAQPLHDDLVAVTAAGLLTLLAAALQAQLKKQISETVQLCKQSLFIFDEAEKLHFSLLDAIKPFMAHYDNEGQVDYQRSIFLFLR